jgi:deoxycytidine triphosphate deaminase
MAMALGSCSIDLRLGNRFRIFDHSKFPFIDPNNPHCTGHDEGSHSWQRATVYSQPGDFV